MILRPVQDAEAACDGRESRPLWGSVQILRDIRRMDDLGEPNQGCVSGQVEVLNQRFEGALAISVGVLGPGAS
jgi:hypothetical protein